MARKHPRDLGRLDELARVIAECTGTTPADCMFAAKRLVEQAGCRLEPRVIGSLVTQMIVADTDEAAAALASRVLKP